MSARHDMILRPAEGENPPDLLQQIVEDVKKLVPTSGEAARKYVAAKGEEAVAKVQEIKARIYEKIAQLEIERQRLTQERDESWHKAELEAQRDEDAHEAKMKELELQRLHEKRETLREVVDCIGKLRELGIETDLKVIRKAQKAMTGLLDA